MAKGIVGWGLLAVLPFIGLASASWLAPVGWHGALVHTLIVYASLLVAFDCGVRWGGMPSEQGALQGRGGILFAVILSFAAVVLPWSVLGLSVLVLAVLLCGWPGSFRLAGKAPRFYSGVLVILATLSLLSAIASYARMV